MKPPTTKERKEPGDFVKCYDLLQNVKALPLDSCDAQIVQHIDNGSHGWWFFDSQMKLLSIIKNKYDL